MLIVMAGLPASGKSAIAGPLSDALPAVLLDKDSLRVSMFQDKVDYSREQNDLVVNISYDIASYLIGKHANEIVLLDGRTYSRRYQVEAVKAAAAGAGTELRIIECVCSEASAITRLQQDHSHPALDRDVDMYLRSRAQADPIEEPKLVIDTDKLSPTVALTRALVWLRAAA